MLTVWMSQYLRIVLLTITLHKGDKMKYLLIIAAALLIGGCAEQILAIPGGIIESITGSGSEVSE